ncbi:hypothetical protein ABZS66_27090 [Dactylosporangium sp. NPDC005572]|uniref:hypothetical protein n=1 Tax=Dactylosporangium sp. NPDC005572 TaxID=3156889 RepID=UPI0033AAB083
MTHIRFTAVLLTCALLAVTAADHGHLRLTHAAEPASERTERHWVTPQGRLLALAAHLAPTASDLAPGTGSCVRLRRHVQIGAAILVVESTRWITSTGAGAVAERRVSLNGGNADTAPSLSSLLDQTSYVVTTYAPGQVRSPVGDPVPADADLLASRIAERTHGAAESASVMAALADLAGVRYLDAGQRAGVLRVLAMLPSLTIVGERTDGVGHGSITFQFDDDTTTYTFAVDAASGRLLSYETADLAAGRQTTLLLRSTRCSCPPSAKSAATTRFSPPTLHSPISRPAAGRVCPTSPYGTWTAPEGVSIAAPWLPEVPW